MAPCVLAERERQRLYAAANGLPHPSEGWKARRDERKSEKHRNDRALAAQLRRELCETRDAVVFCGASSDREVTLFGVPMRAAHRGDPSGVVTARAELAEASARIAALTAERDALAEHLVTSETWRMDSAQRPAPGPGVARLQHLVDATADTIGAKVVLTRAEALALLAEVSPARDRTEEP